MDKIDILGYNSNKYPDDVLNENIEKLPDTNNQPNSADFALFIRDQRKKNFHLNFYSKTIKRKGSKTDKILQDIKFESLAKEEIVAILAKYVIYVTDEIVVLNKPSGLTVQDGKDQCISIAEILEEFSKYLKLNQKLHLVHRLDKYTTGVLLLARNPEMAFLLKDSFKKGEVRKNYLCLTNGIPNPKEGIIDFRLKEIEKDGHFVIRPDMKYIMKSPEQKEKFSPTCTAYKMLSFNYNVALLQCAMASGVKHQIRAHLAYGLETPILGDHKYSWFIKSSQFPILPQKLSPPTLSGLKITEGKTRNLSIHLHAHQIIIGDAPLPKSQYDGTQNLNPTKIYSGQNRLPNLHFYANLPASFVKTLKILKLYDMRILKSLIKHIL